MNAPPHPDMTHVIRSCLPRRRRWAQQVWYRTKSTCAQGPFEVELDSMGGLWGEDFELRVQTPRKIALHAVVLVDGVEVAKTNGVYDPRGATGGAVPVGTLTVATASRRSTAAPSAERR